MALGSGKCTHIRFPGIYISNVLSKSTNANTNVPDSNTGTSDSNDTTSILGKAIIGKMKLGRS